MSWIGEGGETKLCLAPTVWILRERLSGETQSKTENVDRRSRGGGQNQSHTPRFCCKCQNGDIWGNWEFFAPRFDVKWSHAHFLSLYHRGDFWSLHRMFLCLGGFLRSFLQFICWLIVHRGNWIQICGFVDTNTKSFTAVLLKLGGWGWGHIWGARQ